MVPGKIMLSGLLSENQDYVFLKGLHFHLEDASKGQLELEKHGLKEPYELFYDSFYLTSFPDDISKIRMVWNAQDGVKNLFFTERGTLEELPVVATEIFLTSEED